MSRISRSAVILLVEDDHNDVLLLNLALKKADVPYPIHVVRDGETAIEYLSGTGAFQDRGKFPVPCLVILDVNLPKKTGIEVLQWLRRREELRDMPVVMLTSGERKIEKEIAFRNGVEDFFVKPVDLEELVKLAGTIRIEAEEHCEDARPCPTEKDSGK
jgi:CheY-like chemotaxis protein